MHYLSRYQLSIPETRLLKLTDSYSVHSLVYSLFGNFPENSRSFLFADKGNLRGIRTIMILSSILPTIPSTGKLQIKEIPERFLQRNKYLFEITVNPVKRNKSTGQIYVIHKNDVDDWFRAKSTKLGFNVTHSELKKFSVDKFNKKFNGELLDVTIAKATLTGTLSVSDPDIFASTVFNGIGRAKAFGCGLLQIVPFR